MTLRETHALADDFIRRARQFRSTTMTTDDELIRLLHRHVVPIFFSFRKGSTEHKFVLTAFVLSVSDQWFLVTAGHCVRDIEAKIDEGFELTLCQLVDSLGQGAKHLVPITFAYADSYPTYMSVDSGFDYGVILLSTYYRLLLEANNVKALDEEVWKKQPKEVDFYALLGIPAELTVIGTHSIELTPTLHSVVPIGERPEGFTETVATLFYGRIELGDVMKSIVGMSGGPVFAFRTNEKGELRYWITALQSRWLPDTLYIAACPTKLLGDILEDILMRTTPETP